MAKRKNKNYRTEVYFVGGKMKRRRIPLIEGMEVHEFVRRNADDVFLVQAGYYEILHERETAAARMGEGSLERGRQEGSAAADSAASPADGDDDIPF